MTPVEAEIIDRIHSNEWWTMFYVSPIGVEWCMLILKHVLDVKTAQEVVKKGILQGPAYLDGRLSICVVQVPKVNILIDEMRDAIEANANWNTSRITRDEMRRRIEHDDLLILERGVIGEVLMVITMAYCGKLMKERYPNDAQ